MSEVAQTARLALVAIVLGLAASYVLWGRRPPPEPTGIDQPTVPTQPPRTPTPPQPDPPAPPALPQSALKAEPPLVQLKDVKPDTNTEAVFQIHNPSANPILVTKVEPGCGCTTAELDQPLIPPKQSRTLKAIYAAKPGKLRDKVGVTLITDEPGNPRLTPFLEVEIHQEFFLEPEGLDFGKLKGGEAKTLQFRLYHADKTPFKLLRMRSSKKSFAFESESFDQGPRAEHIVKVLCLADEVDIGYPLFESVQISTDLQSQAALHLKIRLSASILGLYQAEPPLLLTQQLPNGTLAQPLIFHLSHAQKKEIRLREVRDGNNREVGYEVLPPKNGETPVKIWFKHPLPTNARISGTLSFTLEGPRLPLTTQYLIAAATLPPPAPSSSAPPTPASEPKK